MGIYLCGKTSTEPEFGCIRAWCVSRWHSITSVSRSFRITRHVGWLVVGEPSPPTVTVTDGRLCDGVMVMDSRSDGSTSWHVSSSRVGNERFWHVVRCHLFSRTYRCRQRPTVHMCQPSRRSLFHARLSAVLIRASWAYVDPGTFLAAVGRLAVRPRRGGAPGNSRSHSVRCNFRLVCLSGPRRHMFPVSRRRDKRAPNIQVNGRPVTPVRVRFDHRTNTETGHLRLSARRRPELTSSSRRRLWRVPCPCVCTAKRVWLVVKSVHPRTLWYSVCKASSL